MTITEKLQSKLLKHIADSNTTPNQIKERKTPNIYPIGTRAVYVFAKYGQATDSHKWKLLQFFDGLELE